MEHPSSKRSKVEYKICGHCWKELNMKIYKDHKKLYYDAIDKSWVQDGASDTQAGDLSSSDFSSIDDIDLLTSENDNIAMCPLKERTQRVMKVILSGKNLLKPSRQTKVSVARLPMPVLLNMDFLLTV